ncbi:MAG: hypothetical protein IPJ19_20665 [Planctomycetes bacterium]|nr:hypothetical protein [Planctomycetota bacterium]
MAAPLFLALLLAGLAQEPAAGPSAPSAERPASRVCFFMLSGELKAEPLRKALAELSSTAAQCRILEGPRKTGARPGAQFVAVEAPAALGAKELIAALRKGCGGAEPLSFTAFEGKAGGQGADAESAGFLGLPTRDFVLGMSGDIRWYDTLSDWRQFYFAAGKIGAKEIADRYHKLFGPVGGGEAGEVAREELQWTLAEPLDPKAAERAHKALAKLPGVARAVFDAPTRALRLDVRLENQKSSGPPGKRAEKAGPVRVRFDTLPVFEILDKEKLALEPAAPAEAGK